MRRQDVQDATGRSEYNPGYGQMRAWGKGSPTNGQQGFAPGCIYQNLTGVIGTCLWCNIGTFSSSQWINVDNPDGGLVQVTAATLTISALVHAGRTLLLNKSGGITVTMPAATGSGLIYRFEIYSVSTTGYVVNVPTGTMNGNIVMVPASVAAADGAAQTAGTTITLNGTTSGGVTIGDWFQLQDVGTALWNVT